MCGLNSKKPELLSSKLFLEEQLASKENEAVPIDFCISVDLKKEPVVGEGSAYNIKKGNLIDSSSVRFIILY